MVTALKAYTREYEDEWGPLDFSPATLANMLKEAIPNEPDLVTKVVTEFKKIARQKGSLPVEKKLSAERLQTMRVMPFSRRLNAMAIKTARTGIRCGPFSLPSLVGSPPRGVTVAAKILTPVAFDLGQVKRQLSTEPARRQLAAFDLLSDRLDGQPKGGGGLLGG